MPDTKLTETPEFGVEKVLFQGHARRVTPWVANACKSPELPESFQQGIFKGQVGEGASQGMRSAHAQSSD